MVQIIDKSVGLFISEYAGFTTESTAGYVFTSIKVVQILVKFIYLRWIVLDCVLVTGCNAFVVEMSDCLHLSAIHKSG